MNVRMSRSPRPLIFSRFAGSVGSGKVDGSKPALSWLKPDGKTQASVPAAVKEQFPAEVKSLKLAEKEIGKRVFANTADDSNTESQARQSYCNVGA